MNIEGLENTLTLGNFLICIGSGLLIGVILALSYRYKTKSTKGFVSTLILLPAIVSFVIMLVNGNIGTGVAVAGAFSLVRFRSIPGTAKEIGTIFLAMSAGLAIGMGFIIHALIFTAILSLIVIILKVSKLGERNSKDRYIKLTIPENINYTVEFKDLFDKYTTKTELLTVKTANLGSLFKLKYECNLKNEDLEKEFIDELRCRNGNLEVHISKVADTLSDL